MQSHRIDAKRLITYRFKMDQIMEAYDVFGHAAKTHAIKVVIDFG